MESYCLKKRRKTKSIPGSGRYERTKNSRKILKSTCASCGITKCKFVKETHGDGIGDVLLSAGIKSLYELGKVGTKNLLKSDMTKRAAAKYIKSMSGRMIDQGVKPSGKTDAVAMQHDVDYSLCKDDKNCKHKADKKMLRSLDAIPWKERQWGHAAVRNTIVAKQKLGLGISGNGKRR